MTQLAKIEAIDERIALVVVLLRLRAPPTDYSTPPRGGLLAEYLQKELERQPSYF
jgi:hypothetical protein